MQAIVETVFDAAYLIFVISVGVLMLRRCGGNRQYRLFGAMAVVLGAGDSFHLIPRAVALCTTCLDSYTVALGIGKLVTSLTMTVFYVLLYHVWQLRYNARNRHGLTCLVYLLARREKFTVKAEAPKYVGAVFETVGQLFYIYALADEEHVMMSAPIISAYCVASVLWSRIFLKEKLSWKHYAMIVLVVAGIVVLGVYDI